MSKIETMHVSENVSRPERRVRVIGSAIAACAGVFTGYELFGNKNVLLGAVGAGVMMYGNYLYGTAAEIDGAMKRQEIVLSSLTDPNPQPQAAPMPVATETDRSLVLPPTLAELRRRAIIIENVRSRQAFMRRKYGQR